MTRWLPFPRSSLLILLMWLLLNQTLAPSHIALGALLALLAPRLLALMEIPPGYVSRPLTALLLAWRVLTDIIRSNIAVAGIILQPHMRKRVSGFVHIQLASRNPYVLATLACIITATPGTIWVDYESASGVLIIHVLDLVDENVWIDTITQRYERLLREIFE